MKPVQFLTVAVALVLASRTTSVLSEERSSDQVTLRIVADIDGSDRLSISGREILWIHRHWDWPNRVRINQVEWQPKRSPVLPERQLKSLFTTPVDFSSARITVRQGRDAAVMETFDDHVLIHFVDSPNGRSTYDLTVTFDRRGETPQSSLSGLIGMAYVKDEKTNIVLRYANGKTLAPTLLAGTVVPSGQVTDGIQINLRGELCLPKNLTVRVRHAGGSSTRGYATLSINGKVLETLGDDRKKVSEHVLELSGGKHPIKWQISGGDIGHCLLEFVDASSGKSLSVAHTPEHIGEMGVDKSTQYINVQSERTGWPIPNGW